MLGLGLAACPSASSVRSASGNVGTGSTGTSGTTGTSASGTSGTSGVGVAGLVSAPTTIPPGAASACKASDLHLAYQAWSRAPLKMVTEVVLTNTSSSSCNLVGFPTVSATTAEGTAFRFRSTRRWPVGAITNRYHPSKKLTAPPLVTLAPGAKALFFYLTGTYLPTVPSGETGNQETYGECEKSWSGAKVEIGLPEGGNISAGPMTFPACQDNPLRVEPIQPDAGGLPSSVFSVPPHQSATS